MDNDHLRIDQLWDVMNGEKGDLVVRSEEYARWTIPYICPLDASEGSEQDKGEVAIGPRLVNHLANKIVDVMFPHDRPNFTIALTPEMRRTLREEMGKDGEAQFAQAVREETAAVEEAAMRKMKLTTYRPKAVEAVKHLIITGNSLIRRLKNGTRIVYGVKDFCIRRDIFGNPIEVMLRDATKFGSLSAVHKSLVKQDGKDHKDTDPLVLYTHFKLEGFRWVMRQAVEGTEFPTVVRYTQKDCPFIALAWNLSRGDNYGRGHVEDHTTAFHQLDVLSLAKIDMAGVMADIKFFVDPASVLDVSELNNSPRGSYHQGRKDDVTTPEGARRLEIGVVEEMTSKLERELAQAFLLNSSVVRDAERVTAEEIRFIAMELESAFGGLYSRLAIDWQQREAEYAVSQINFGTDLNTKVATFEVLVTTGLETLSREGQLDNLRRAFNDLQMLDAIPESIVGVIDPVKIATFIFTNHAVKYSEFMYTPEEQSQNSEDAMNTERDLLNAQADAKVREEAGKQAVTGE